MEDTQAKIQRLNNEIKELEAQNEVRRLEEHKRVLLTKNLDDTVEGDCPYCGISLRFDSKDRMEKETTCPRCAKRFELNEAKNKFTSEDIKNSKLDKGGEANENIEFENLLSSFKLTVLLTIFFDFFFIPTLWAISQRSKLTSLKNHVTSTLFNSFTTWDGIFIIILLIKIIIFALVVFSALAADSSYNY